MSLVLDCSATLAWVLANEPNDAVDRDASLNDLGDLAIAADDETDRHA